MNKSIAVSDGSELFGVAVYPIDVDGNEISSVSAFNKDESIEYYITLNAGAVSQSGLTYLDVSGAVVLASAGALFPTDICMSPVGGGSSVDNAGGSIFDRTTSGAIKQRAFFDESVSMTVLAPYTTVEHRKIISDFYDDNYLNKFTIFVPFDRSGGMWSYYVSFKSPPLPVSQNNNRIGIKLDLIGIRN